MKKETTQEVDVVLIGGGIMSATLGTLINKLRPDLTVEIFEKLDKVATESSHPWNNAGTGHSGFCELNYYPENPDGTVEIKKGVTIAEHFEVSKQFWSHLVAQNILPNPKDFIQPVPHISFVWGEKNVQYLEQRYLAMQKSPLFKGIQFSTDFDEISKWMPLVMNGRDRNQKVAATKIDYGTDVNFGKLTSNLFDYLEDKEQINLRLNHDVSDLKRNDDGSWNISVTDEKNKIGKTIKCKFVFIGAGGGALLLLEKSGIAEAEGIGGFPVSGQWLKCTNPEIIKQHGAKVYGKASVGAPPMSVPHIDSRVIDGKRELLFGPYAGFSTKFLKQGSYWDLIKSITFSNLIPSISAGIQNLSLVKYLFGQVVQSDDKRMESLKEYYPLANKKDWELITAGQRVQVIGRKENGMGELQFGTEIVYSKDGSIAALLGASPGASSSVSIMLDLISKCFPKRFEDLDVQEKIRKMIPSFGKSLNDNPELCAQVRTDTIQTLKLNDK